MATSSTQQKQHARSRWRSGSVWAVYAVGLAPAVWYFWLGATNRLGVDPVKSFEHLLGIWALRFILLTLCVTPLRDLANINLLRYRRALGLLGFYYVCFHFLVYMVLDQQMNLAVVVQDVIKRPFITFGMIALVLLIPLAVTSNNWSIRKLKQNWVRLHRLVYVIAGLGTLHFAMGRKVIGPEIMFYIAAATLLLGYRLIRPKLMERRRARKKAARMQAGTK
ncbi:protein-methionine-sulfoxide reductase heme-binding subunit MsrQ [Martelella mediterranea]|uniref:Protein-methionine-sulfoxide reductase heme-binding subunit MsrQ n=1 Tax=Martelella mediterranea TaxID=293089 RepID=A0A4V2V3U1_9HYPH|nr:protein-methionine-sulfoxide reductase heme-binding subunit MsrQ [Martelella mediterranea]TCT35518.1 sulfoxide reductase heme-binding subunit YedZ [Martelella mediterranea]